MAFLNAARRFLTFASLRARIWAARMPALAAPHFPTATVATGTPLGIWAMERSASRPLRGEELMGTPMMGSDVRDARKPGRAAPPPIIRHWRASQLWQR